MNKSSTDLGIPLLTEVIAISESEVEQLSVPVIETTAALVPPVQRPVEKRTDESADESAKKQAAIGGWLDEEWTRVEQKIRDSVLAQLQERVDTMIDQRIRESIADVLQGALTRMIDDLRLGLQQTLEDVVADAVSHEIERTRFPKN